MNKAKALKQLKQLKKLTPNPPRLAAEGWKKDWQSLIATLLSARTTDEVTIKVSEVLFKNIKIQKR